MHTRTHGKMHIATNIVREMATINSVACLARACLGKLKWSMLKKIPLSYPQSFVALATKAGLHDNKHNCTKCKQLLH